MIPLSEVKKALDSKHLKVKRHNPGYYDKLLKPNFVISEFSSKSEVVYLCTEINKKSRVSIASFSTKGTDPYKKREDRPTMFLSIKEICKKEDLEAIKAAMVEYNKQHDKKNTSDKKVRSDKKLPKASGNKLNTIKKAANVIRRKKIDPETVKSEKERSGKKGHFFGLF